MKNKWLDGIAILIIVLAVVMGYRHESNQFESNNGQRRIASVSSKRKSINSGSLRKVNYRIRTTNIKTQRVTRPENVWQKPNHDKREKIGTTASLLKSPNKYTNLVQIDRQAAAKNKPTYDHITRQGKSIGWIDARGVKSTSVYMLPYVYISQFWPSPAQDACEEASLKTALSTQGKAMNVPLRKMVQQTPRSNDPNRGYTNNPYEYGSHATIYPDALVKVAHKYKARAKVMNHATKAQFINAVTHGHTVVFEGPYMLQKPGSDHDLVILGYKKGRFFVADPFARHHYSPRTRWASTGLLMKLYNKRFRGQRSLVIE